MFFAHSGPSRERWEPLAEHLRDVAERAAGFAEAFGAAEEARLAGLLHDLGKYSDRFTLRLEGKDRGLDHWSMGAWAALARYRQAGIAAALAIQGHHVGLQQTDNDSLRALEPRSLIAQHPLGLQLTEPDLEALLARLAADGLALPPLASSLYSKDPSCAGQLDVRMLFSALVDADFLETEGHFRRGLDGAKHRRPEALALRPGEALAHLQQHVARLERKTPVAPEVRSLRSDLFAACLAAGDRPPGLFTLTAPTGAGKTLAMLAFAFRHALRHGLRRIVVAIPFLSILEQTARVYRELLEPAFGEGYVLEHHSLAGRGPESRGSELDPADEPGRLAAWLRENWDAPLVVTTSVQLLESLFANRPSACRKLHRLAGSVLLFDEVQTLPPGLAVPTLATLSRLAERFGATVVFATATQPAFESLHEKVQKLATGGWRPGEIASPELALFARAKRTHVRWEETPRSWESLAEELAGLGSALSIVNLKRHAQALAGLLQARGAPGLFHLSTNLCPAHRERMLAAVRSRLAAREPCLLVSTQCVEAGVDVDFPVVLRAFGPLEAIAQAAGRCNRNGRLAEGGLVRVFVPEEERYPGGAYEQAAKVTRMLLRSKGAEALDLDDPELFRLYYQTFYDLTKAAAGESGKGLKLLEMIRAGDFARVSECYRLIDQDAISVLVPYDLEAYASLRADLARQGRLSAGWIRRARAHAVNLYRPKRDDPVWAHLEPAPLGRGELSEDWFVYLTPSHYDRDLLGLVGAPERIWIA